MQTVFFLRGRIPATIAETQHSPPPVLHAARLLRIGGIDCVDIVAPSTLIAIFNQ